MKPAAATPQTPLTLGRSSWAIQPDVLPRIIEAHRSRASRASLDQLLPRADVPVPQAAVRANANRTGGAVAIIPLTGILTPRGSFLSLLFGGASGGLMGFREAFRDALNSPDVGAIVIDVDSPGGQVALTPETAAEVREARGTKPIVAVANTMAASGAYYIASQADEVVATPSGWVGSIGVYMVHEDWSKWNEDFGVLPTYISAGKYKVEGNMDEPLGDEAQASMQQDVDDMYATFIADVAAGRGVSEQVVRDSYGEGRTLMAERALAAGMIDRIDTIESVIGGLLTPGSSGGAAALAGRMAIIRPSAESPTPPAGDETDPAGDQPPAGPTHVPAETPDDAIDDADKDVVEPDVGPDAPAPEPADDAPADEPDAESTADDRAAEFDVLTS